LPAGAAGVALDRKDIFEVSIVFDFNVVNCRRGSSSILTYGLPETIKIVGSVSDIVRAVGLEGNLIIGLGKFGEGKGDRLL